MDQPDQGIMTFFEAEAHSFVLRIWRENRENPTDTEEWRGWVEHVQSAQRHYFRSVSEIGHIVSAYVGEVAEFEEQIFMPINSKSATQ